MLKFIGEKGWIILSRGIRGRKGNVDIYGGRGDTMIDYILVRRIRKKYG